MFKKFILFLGLFTCINPYLFAQSHTQKALDCEHYGRIVSQATQLFSKSDVESALDRLSVELTDQMSNKNPTFLCALTGAIVPMGQLLTRLDFPLKIDYVHATRYRGEIKGGNLDFVVEPHRSLEGQVVVIVDDILDSGATMMEIKNYCFEKGAKEVHTLALIDKKRERSEERLPSADFVGLVIPNKFIVGCGMDYKEYFRNLDGIHVMPENELF